MHHHHNKQYGLRWSDFTSYIEEYALGRKIDKGRGETVRRKEPAHHRPHRSEAAGKPSTKAKGRMHFRCVRPSFVYEKGNPHDRNHSRDRSGTSRT